MTTLTLMLTLIPHYAIIINEDEHQSAKSEVDLKSKVGCFLSKSPQVILGTSRRPRFLGCEPMDSGTVFYSSSDWPTM